MQGRRPVVEGLRGEPTVKPPFPSVSGYKGKPTNVNNVETFANIPAIINKGAEWFSAIGTEKCLVINETNVLASTCCDKKKYEKCTGAFLRTMRMKSRVFLV